MRSCWPWPRVARAVTFALALLWMWRGGPQTLGPFALRMIVGALVIVAVWIAILKLATRQYARRVGHGPPFSPRPYTHCGDCGRTEFPAHCYAATAPIPRGGPCMPMNGKRP